MKKIPTSCHKCGAPIKWEKGATQTTCDYCGQLNSLTPVFGEKKSKEDCNQSTSKLEFFKGVQS